MFCCWPLRGRFWLGWRVSKAVENASRTANIRHAEPGATHPVADLDGPRIGWKCGKQVFIRAVVADSEHECGALVIGEQLLRDLALISPQGLHFHNFIAAI